MTLVPLDVAATICGVKPGTIRRWVHDRHITRHPHDGHGEYDVSELLHWIDTRNPDALYSRYGLKMSDRPGRISA